MVGTQSGNTLRLPECSGRGDEDAEQHWFLCEAIWTDKETNDATKLVEFKTTLRGRALQWYIKLIHCPQGGIAPTLDELKQQFVTEFQQPKSRQ